MGQCSNFISHALSRHVTTHCEVPLESALRHEKETCKETPAVPPPQIVSPMFLVFGTTFKVETAIIWNKIHATLMKVSFPKFYNGSHDRWEFKSRAECLSSMQEALGSIPGITEQQQKLPLPLAFESPVLIEWWCHSEMHSRCWGKVMDGVCHLRLC